MRLISTILALSAFCSTALRFNPSNLPPILNRLRGHRDNILSSFAREFGENNLDILDRAVSSTNPIQLETLFVAKLMKSIASTGVFTAAFTGSSITDGGDIYYNQAYPFVYSELLHPMYTSLDVDLKIRNVANGNNPIVPYDLCVEALAGEDVDFVSWEQQLNCPNAECVEAFIRNSLAIPSRPIVSVCEPGVDIRSVSKIGRIFGRLIGNGNELLRHYSEQGIHLVSGTKALQGKENNQDPNLSATRLIAEGKTFGHAGWHPGPQGHRLLAYYFASQHSKYWVSAVERLVEMWEATGKVLETYEKEIGTFVGEHQITKLPADAFNSIELFKRLVPDAVSDLSNVHRIKCATVYEPRYNPKFDLRDFVVNIQNTETSSSIRRESIVDARPSISEFNVPDDRWILAINPQRVTSSKLGQERGSPVKKYAMLGNKNSGELTFEVNVEHPGPIAVCNPNMKENGYQSGLSHAIFRVDGETVIPEPFQYLCYLWAHLRLGRIKSLCKYLRMSLVTYCCLIYYGPKTKRLYQ